MGLALPRLAQGLFVQAGQALAVHQFGHDIRTLYSESLNLMPIYRPPNAFKPTRTDNDEALIDFFTEYGVESRYFNLNEVCEAKMNRNPLEKWFHLASSIYEEYTPNQIRQKSAMNLMYNSHYK